MLSSTTTTDEAFFAVVIIFITGSKLHTNLSCLYLAGYYSIGKKLSLSGISASFRYQTMRNFSEVKTLDSIKLELIFK